MKRAVFFDRDGVINVDKSYIYKKEDIEWVDGALETLAALKEKGYVVLVVTNQSGIARGLYSEEDLQILHSWMNEVIVECGGKVEEFFYCPHLVKASVADYDQDCVCRKPRPGMIIRGLSKYGIKLENAIMIGDQARDVAAAERAGIEGYLFDGGNLFEFVSGIFEKKNW